MTNDIIEKFTTPVEVSAEVSVAETPSPATGQDVPSCGDMPGDKPTRRFKLVRFDQIRLPTDPAYLVKGLIPREGLCIAWGPPKCGKSFWTYDVAMHIACGWEYRGRKVKPGPVVYVACEGERGLGARTEAYRQHKDTTGADFYLVTTRLDLIAEHKTLISDIAAVVAHPVAVVIDTLNRSLRGSESRDEDMGDYLRAADAIREAFSCTVIMIHHCGIEGSRPRGHTSLTGACDAQIAVKKGHDGTVTCTVEYMKDGPEGDEIHSKLELVDVGMDDDGDVITSCVVAEAERVKTDTTHKLTKNQATMLGLLDDFGPGGTTVENWNVVARQEDLGVKRKADLRDFRKALKDKRLVHTTNDRWYVTKL